MNLSVIARPVLYEVAQAAEFVFDRFIRQPLNGLATISEAFSLLVPDLAEAATTAVLRAVSAQLTPAGRVRINQGVQLLRWGIQQLAWPLGLGAIILVSQIPGVCWVLALAMFLTVLVLGQSTPSTVTS